MHKKTISALLVSSLFTTFGAYAEEQPTAESLVGKNYIGIHGMRMDTDDDRLTPNEIDFIKHANGVGVEFGHRLSEFSELRLSYTRLNLTRTGWAPNTPSGKNIAANYLYFPNKQNFYVMGGASVIDVIDSDLSANIGAGYRHYLSERSAIYLEGNGHYQFDNKYTDISAQIGFTYFFGDTAKKVERTKPVKAAPVVAKVLDSDKDGVINSKDLCKNTPANNKVNSNGCTIFTEENDTLRLQVNFDNAKATVKQAYFDEIKVAADFLTKYPHVSLVIKGHTSRVGSAAFNKKLSQQRAEAVVAVLTNKFGVDASRLTAIGMGEEGLLNTANTAAAHAENRRIEAKAVVKMKKAVKR